MYCGLGSLGRLLPRIRKPFVSKIDFKKILAKRCTDPVRIENPGTPTKHAIKSLKDNMYCGIGSLGRLPSRIRSLFEQIFKFKNEENF